MANETSRNDTFDELAANAAVSEPNEHDDTIVETSEDEMKTELLETEVAETEVTMADPNEEETSGEDFDDDEVLEDEDEETLESIEGDDDVDTDTDEDETSGEDFDDDDELEEEDEEDHEGDSTQVIAAAPRKGKAGTKSKATLSLKERKAAERERIARSKEIAANARGKNKKKPVAQLTKEQARYSQPKTQNIDDANPVWFKPIMFGFLLLGLLWILVYYLSSARLPIRELGDWNLLVGIGIAMVGFLMMTNWK